MMTPECIADVGNWLWKPDAEPEPMAEAVIRSAANRLYYSAYHRALRMADAKKFQLKSVAKGSHDKLIKRLADNNASLLSRKLRSMKEIRCHADYDLTLQFEEKHLKEMSLRLADVVSLTQ
ncbi:hypothetical protein [Vogesella oryzae]|uniref:hypothetical protein n=1 Tax=Vogesella oryzae TaxID=1735285 RepID=UPI0015830F71|nr:hypothetical protein [Vogesella oryzae]